MARHLVGLQAQENLPPYLSLAARLDDFDPHAVTRGLEDRSLVRLVVMRGTIHLLTADDALMLRQWTQPVQERERTVSQNVEAALHLDTAEVNAAISDALARRSVADEGTRRGDGERFPDVPPDALGQLARVNQPLAQVPPRGAWKQSGGVVLPVRRPLARPPARRRRTRRTIVRRYLRAFGPASAADVGAWSGLTRLAAVLKEMDDLVEHEDEDGKTLFDVPDGEFADADAPAPVRLLGTYDNVWLSHAARDRVTDPEKRYQWMGANGGVAMIDVRRRLARGPVAASRTAGPRSSPCCGSSTRAEQAELDEEFDRVTELLAR